mmetsp:Transcript_23637/g.42079  ORF Transcript_23637/g.42079 Transcript_23637/m.42079 type:complete len:227 (+) Transcript_23637:533-1213(+)
MSSFSFPSSLFSTSFLSVSLNSFPSSTHATEATAAGAFCGMNLGALKENFGFPRTFGEGGVSVASLVMTMGALLSLSAVVIGFWADAVVLSSLPLSASLDSHAVANTVILAGAATDAGFKPGVSLEETALSFSTTTSFLTLTGEVTGLLNDEASVTVGGCVSRLLGGTYLPVVSIAGGLAGAVVAGIIIGLSEPAVFFPCAGLLHSTRVSGIYCFGFSLILIESIC